MKVHYPKLYNMAHLLALNVLLLPKDLTIIFIGLREDLKDLPNMGISIFFLVTWIIYLRIISHSHGNFTLHLALIGQVLSEMFEDCCHAHTKSGLDHIMLYSHAELHS